VSPRTRVAKHRAEGKRRRKAVLSRQQSREAARQGAEARELQAAAAGRAVPVSRDTSLVEVRISTRLVREAAKVVDRDPGLVPWVEGHLVDAQKGPGRPGALSVRTALICLWLLNVTQRNCHVINLPALVSGLSRRVRSELGIDYLDNRGEACQIGYQQLLLVFNNIADAFDPLEEDLEEDEARARAAALQELTLRLVRASVDDPGHSGGYAVDATLVWAWNRPVRGLNGKIERRGRDGDAGPPLALAQIINEDANTDPDLADVGFVDDPLLTLREAGALAPQPEPHRADEGPPNPFRGLADDQPDDVVPVPNRKARRSKRIRPGALWVGRDNKRKSVYGYAMHSATCTDPTKPSVIEALAVTPAPAHPAKAAMPLLRALHDVRQEDPRTAESVASGAAPPLGLVVADPAYSATADEWMHPIRELGGSAVFRLHRTNQAGPRHHRGQLFVDGRPYCSCMPTELVELEFPRFPYSRIQMKNYQEQVQPRRQWEMLPNGDYRSNGSRQFKSPHHATDRGAMGEEGGCTFCVDAHGHAVVEPVTGLAKNRCCTQRTKVFRKEELGLYQKEAFGTREWYADWTPRNRVEGSYGILKSLALVNWGRDYHHFTGLVRETLVAALAVMAHNHHVQRTFYARQDLLAEDESPGAEDRLPSKAPTQTLPGSIAVAEKEAVAAAREASPRGPKGLEFLGTPRRAGP